jgi:catechol 2,3-dioxygenase-like lactoylglutathione lyase family enzyme
MKRLHVHVAVKNLDASIRFYSQLFAAEPSVRKPDYAKWMLEDPRVNFAISERNERGVPSGVDHLGIQVEDRAELQDVCARLKKAEAPVIEEGETTCCYAQSAKSWSADPQGVQWEAFLTTGESTVYGTDELRSVQEKRRTAASCCAPSCCSSEAA